MILLSNVFSRLIFGFHTFALVKSRFLQAWQGWLAGRAGQGVNVVNAPAVGPIETYNVF